MLPDNQKSAADIMAPQEGTRCIPTATNYTSTPTCPLTTAALAATMASPTLSTKSISSNAASWLTSTPLALEGIMPGIYLAKNFLAWSDEKIRSHGFTHVITIDRHIQEICHPSKRQYDERLKSMDLNFGEKTYLTTVLPNCYKSVKFIDKALSGGGTILVLDCNGGDQKCLTIIAAYLMYKNNYNFSDAFSRLQVYYKKADLDRFYISQLYEYEPILQVQRAQSRGHSCSRELYSSKLKRKKRHDDPNDLLHNSSLAHCPYSTHDDITME